MRLWILAFLATVVPRVLQGGTIEYHWKANATYDLDIPDLNLSPKVLSERERFKGILEGTEVKVVGGWDVEASAKLEGTGYTLRADAYVKAEHWVSGKGLSTSTINAGMNWNDRYRIVGEGELPFNSTVAKWKFHGDFEHGDGDRQRFYYWEVYGKVTFSDPGSTNSFNTTVEYFRTNREFVEGIGSSLFSGLATFTYDLDSQRSTPYNFNLGIDARTEGSWLRIRGGRTFELVAIEFPDGTTPEDHGFQIVFDSGARSPNLAVPEPSTAAYASIFLVCAAVFGARSCNTARRS